MVLHYVDKLVEVKIELVAVALRLFFYMVQSECFKLLGCVFVRSYEELLPVGFYELGQPNKLDLSAFSRSSLYVFLIFKRLLSLSVHASSLRISIPSVNLLVLLLDLFNSLKRFLEDFSMTDFAFPAWALLLDDLEFFSVPVLICV